MIFSQIATDQVIQGFGLPGGLAIMALSAVIIFLYRRIEALMKKYEDAQDLRLKEAIETRDKISVPMENIAKQNEKMYELLVDLDKRRR